MYTVEPVPRVGYIDFAHSQVSSTLHADASRNLAIIFGRVSAGPEETHEGRQACIHTYEHPYEGCAQKEEKKGNQRRHIANSLLQRLSPYLDDAPAGAFFIDVHRIWS